VSSRMVPPTVTLLCFPFAFIGRFGNRGATTSLCSGSCSICNHPGSGTPSPISCTLGRYVPGLVPSAHPPCLRLAHSTVSWRRGHFIHFMCCRYASNAGVGPCTTCPSGLYGSSATPYTADCTGPCSAGYSCLAGSTSSTSAICGQWHDGCESLVVRGLYLSLHVLPLFHPPPPLMSSRWAVQS
jgi:hypothetical protein